MPPHTPGVEQGTLPASWITGGPNCLEVPDWQIHEYNPNLYILRESGCTNYEKPFLYLFFGSERALLIDTGAGASDAAAVTQKLIASWLKRNKRETIAARRGPHPRARRPHRRRQGLRRHCPTPR